MTRGLEWEDITTKTYEKVHYFEIYLEFYFVVLF